MQLAAKSTGYRTLGAQIWLRLGWRRLLLVVGVSMLLSTQLLCQESVLEYFSAIEILESLGLYFLDILSIAIMLVLAMSVVDVRLPDSSAARNAALVLAVLGAVTLGVIMQMGFHYGAGPYPPPAYMLGEAARWALMGGAITLIVETVRRHQRNQQQLHEAELRHRILENQMMEARIKMMEAQIEPHFLFNTLATVKRLYRTEPVGGARMVARLKEYLRAALPQIRYGVPTLASEIELVRAYLEILQIRMGTRLSFAIEVPAESRSIPFPAMVLITLVENAIKHGLNPLPNGGRIEIEAFDSADSMVVEVRDNGVGFQANVGTSGSGIGLANIRARLAALYGPGASLVLLQGSPSGVVARVEIAKRAARNIGADEFLRSPQVKPLAQKEAA